MPRNREGQEMDVGDSAFWMSTYEQHGSAVIAFLTSRTGRRDLAEDQLQETFVRTISARPSKLDPGGIRCNLFMTAHRLVPAGRRPRRQIR